MRHPAGHCLFNPATGLPVTPTSVITQREGTCEPLCCVVINNVRITAKGFKEYRNHDVHFSEGVRYKFDGSDRSAAQRPRLPIAHTRADDAIRFSKRRKGGIRISGGRSITLTALTSIGRVLKEALSPSSARRSSIRKQR